MRKISRPQARLWAGIALALCLLVGLVLAPRVARFLHQIDLLALHVSEPGLGEASRHTGFIFPRSARLLGSRKVWAGQAQEMWLLVEIGERDLEAFKGSVPVDGSWSATDRNDISDALGMITPPAWWRPDSAQRFLACTTRSQRLVLLLIDLDDERRPLVYVYWAG